MYFAEFSRSWCSRLAPRRMPQATRVNSRGAVAARSASPASAEAIVDADLGRARAAATQWVLRVAIGRAGALLVTAAHSDAWAATRTAVACWAVRAANGALSHATGPAATAQSTATTRCAALARAAGLTCRAPRARSAARRCTSGKRAVWNAASALGRAATILVRLADDAAARRSST